MNQHNIKEILYLMDVSLKQLEDRVDMILDHYHQLQKNYSANHETFLEYKQRTLKELKELKMILDNETVLDHEKEILSRHSVSTPLAILMSESDTHEP